MKKLKLKLVSQEQQGQVFGGHIGDGDGPEYIKDTDKKTGSDSGGTGDNGPFAGGDWCAP